MEGVPGDICGQAVMEGQLSPTPFCHLTFSLSFVLVMGIVFVGGGVVIGVLSDERGWLVMGI